jgi:hypothetical protein
MWRENPTHASGPGPQIVLSIAAKPICDSAWSMLWDDPAPVDISIYFGKQVIVQHARNSLEVLEELSIQERIIALDIVLTLNKIRHCSPLAPW